MTPTTSLLLRLSLILSLAFGVQTARAADKSEALVVKLGKPADVAVEFWLETSLKRIYPRTPPGSTNLHLLAARNSRISFQVGVRNERARPLVDCKILEADDFKPRVRFVGLVPLPHFTPNTDPTELEGFDYGPGFIPDPLLPETAVTFGSWESRSYWVSLEIPADAKVGEREFKVQMIFPATKQTFELPVTVEISELVVQPRKDFPIIHWWRGEATWDYYKTGMFEDERWWKITRAQLEDMLAHGSDVVYVPVFFDRRETFKRPCQLLTVNEPTPGQYDFDWTQVKRFTDMCKDIGFKKFEWSHLWIYWGVKNPVRVYKKVDGQYVMLWDPNISGFSDTYTNFLKQFLPQFHDFMVKENILNDSYFHLSDEPGGGEHLANYKRARQILRELAPWMKVMDALSNIEYGRQQLTDMPIPIVSSAQAYIDEKIPHWVYFCCSPTGPWLNRFYDTPLAKIRMSGMLFYHLGAKGFLHWGFNYWHKMEQEVIGDPFHDASNAWWPAIPYGDPFMIYPGADEQPIDSLRWEVFAEAMQDYAILQSAGIKPDDAMLSDIKSYANFPKNVDWIKATMEKILRNPNHKPAKSEP